jgi:hypothetical protein
VRSRSSSRAAEIGLFSGHQTAGATSGADAAAPLRGGGGRLGSRDLRPSLADAATLGRRAAFGGALGHRRRGARGDRGSLRLVVRT